MEKKYKTINEWENDNIHNSVPNWKTMDETSTSLKYKTISEWSKEIENKQNNK